MIMQKQQRVYYSYMTYNDLRIFIAATKEGLCYVSTQVQNEKEATEQIKKYMNHFTLIANDDVTNQYSKAILNYFTENRQSFDFPIDLHGTPFQKEVWQALQTIPYGETATYSEIAEKVGRPKAVQAVGSAIGKNPLLIVIPCHRVIRKNGDLSGFREGIDLKKKLLQLEKIKNAF